MKTHERPWVNWEIEQANKQGKRIVGVYVHGSSDADKPEALERYASAIVGWDSKRIIVAIDGTDNPFELPDGSPRPTRASSYVCEMLSHVTGLHVRGRPRFRLRAKSLSRVLHVGYM